MSNFWNHRFQIVGVLMFAMLCLAATGARAQGVPSGTAHSVTLSWTAPSPVGGSGTVSGYNVYRLTYCSWFRP